MADHAYAALNLDPAQVSRDLDGVDNDHVIQITAGALRILAQHAEQWRQYTVRNTASLITPHGEKIPIPSHVAAQIRSIEYKGGAGSVRVVDDADDVRDAITTRGSRIPSTLTGMPPVAAYNLGWQEGRDSMNLDVRNSKARGYEPAYTDEEREVVDGPEESDERITRMEEPVEDRTRRAYGNGFIDGLQRGSCGRFDHS